MTATDSYSGLTQAQLAALCVRLTEESNRKSADLAGLRAEYIGLLSDVADLLPGAMVTGRARDAAAKLAALGQRCPECGAGASDILHVGREDSADGVYQCGDCSHEWPCTIDCQDDECLRDNSYRYDSGRDIYGRPMPF